ncbi:MAG: hypothetical protein SWK90_12150 [Chloroflexota bacterium]|nr:hypothetical protein [Chloroflexota bacterium]
MIPIYTVFGGLLFLFALIGGLRGWAKELIAAFSVILALFVDHVLMRFVPGVGPLILGMDPDAQFYVHSTVIIGVAIAGYASPAVVSRLGAKVVRERLQDLLLGFVIGALNGFLVIGSLWSLLDRANYGLMPPQAVAKLDDQGQTITDEKTGWPVIVYDPGAAGIGGIMPPRPESTSAKILPYLPPALVARSEAVLYLAVAFAFVFIIIVFI